MIIIGVGSLGITAVSLRRFFKDTEDKSRAMRIASAKMEETIGRGFSALEAPSSSSGNDNGFSWEINLTENFAAGIKASVPYKKAEVIVSYVLDKGSAGINSQRSIRLTNIAAYPIVHCVSLRLEAVLNANVPWIAENSPDNFSSLDIVGNNAVGARLSLNNLQWNTDKDIQIIYNISLNVQDNDGQIRPADTVYTACFFDGEQVGVITRTPLRSQPSFSNIAVVSNAARDTAHNVDVRWYYSNAYWEEGEKFDSPYNNTKISLREAMLTILAVER